jgi:hypothetical protein
MKRELASQLIPVERVQQLILLVRSEKVMLDSHLAALYGVDTGALNRAVKRNAARFPDDFMFQLTPEPQREGQGGGAAAGGTAAQGRAEGVVR